MKFFGWGRKKEPTPVQPTHHEEAKKSDVPARSIHSPGTAKWRSSDAVEQETHGWPSKGVKEALPRQTAPGLEIAWSEERLQETIRFVFSHEQEGLLAIGTFALDQLAGACSNHPANQHRKPLPAIAAATDRNIHIMLQELRSSDDDVFFDTESHGLYSPVPTSACKKKDLPVFGDHDAFSDLHSMNPIVLPVVIKPKDPPSTNTDSPKDDATSIAGKPDDLKLQISNFTCPKPVSRITDCEDEDEQSDDEFCSHGFGCGLFGSRSSRRSGTQNAHLGKTEKRKKLPPEKSARVGENDSKLKRATGRKELGSKLGRLWRSGCNGPPSAGAEIAPEPESERESSRLQISGPPCIANVEREGGTSVAPTLVTKFPSQRKAGEGKRRSHSFGKGTRAYAQNGKWIRTDSEFVVLEM